MTFNFYNLGSVHLFRCIFCHKLAKEPKMMSCMHTACYDCLRDKFKDGGVECIGCDAVNHVKDLSGFADQCYSRNILRAIEQMDVGEKFVHCFLCVKQLYENQMVFASLSRNAESTSSDCDGGDSPAASLNPYIDEKPQAQSIMCEGCLDEHWQQNPGHDIFACLATANGDSLLDETVRTASCVKHNKSYAIYCTKSKKSMCNSCLKSHNGSGHTHLTIDEVKSILKGKVDLEERFHTTFKSHTKSARLLKAALKTEEQNSIANMQKLFIKLKEKISEAEQLLKKKLQSFYSEKTAEIDQMLESSTYFESLGGRLFRTSDDLLSLSSDPEIFTFIAPLLALADQVSTFSSTTDEELRSVLKNKPYMAFNKKTFEDLLSVSFATIELQDVAFVDSLCCSVTENVEEQTTQICISSACESEAFVPENFKIELSVPGKASIALPVSVGNGETKSIEARLDSNLGVKPGLYKLNVTFQGAVVKNCPSHLKVFPNYSEGSKQEKLKYFDLPDELSDIFRSRRKSKSNRSSPKYFPAPDEDFEMLPEDVAPCDIEETNTPRTTNSEKESFLKGTYDETCSSLNTTQNQRANYDDIYYGVLSELNLENQKITVMKAEQLTANEGAFNGQDGSPRVLKTIRIKRNSQQPVTESSIESNIFGEDNYEAGEDYDEQHIYKNYYCDRFKFSTITGGVGIKKLATLGVKFKNSSKKGSFNYPIGCAVSRSDEVVICDHGNDRVQIFDINGKLKSSIGSNILIRPSAVVCAKNGGFAVRADNGIFFFDKDGGNLADRSIKSKFSKSCYGLVAHSDDNLMFLNLVKPQGSLVTVNWDGQFVSEDNFQPLSNATRPAKTKCRFMDSYGGCIFVSDLGASKIYITTPEGQTLQMFGSFGSKREEMNEPAGIKCTENFILVSDSKNNRLKVYDGKGETLSILTFPVGDVIKRPSDICFGSNNVLVVNSFLTHEVFIYRIEV